MSDAEFVKKLHSISRQLLEGREEAKIVKESLKLGEGAGKEEIEDKIIELILSWRE